MDNVHMVYAVNVDKAKAVSTLLKDHVDLQDFVENCDEFTLWINEKLLTAQDTSYEEARNLHSKWLKHQAFKAEIDSNKDRLQKIDTKGQQLAQEKPQFAPTVSEKLGILHEQWNELETTTLQKEQTLFDAHRSELHEQRFADIATWINCIEMQVASDDYGKDLTSVNILLNNHKRIEDQIDQKTVEMDEVLPDVPSLAEDRSLGEKEENIKVRFSQLQEPMHERKRRLQSSKQVHQLHRDLADEILWVQKECLLRNRRIMAITFRWTLQKEIAGHCPRVDDVMRRAEAMEGEPDIDPEPIKKQHHSLQDQWDRLQTATINRQKALNQANEAQQYYMDAIEAEAWIDEQQLYLMGDDKPKDEESAVLMLKKHLILQHGVEQFGKNIKDLAEQSQKLLALEHPDGEQIMRHQDNLEKQYTALRDRADERRQNLDNHYHMFQLKREVEDLEQWIAERDIKASSQEMGQDLDHVTILRDKFRDFAKETGATGQERIDNVNILIEELIDAGHTEAATIAEWKDNLNESWADLLELIDTRVQLLSASYDLHKYFYDGTEILCMIDEKHKELPEELGGDVHTAETLHRVHTDFERSIHFIGSQVQGFQDTATRLYAAYAGDQAMEIQKKEREVTEAWKALLDACDGRRTELSSAAEKFHFFSMVRNLMLWMESIMRQIETQEKPRDVSSVEFLIKHHQELRAEIEARNTTYDSCVGLGETLLARNHPDSEEIKEKLGELAERRAEMMEKWDKRWEWLNILLEVCQFARDASMAEAWLIAKEPYLLTTHVGNSVDDVEKLLKKHEAFEKSTATWEERFAALERLTTLELLEIRRYQEAKLQRMALGADVEMREVRAEIHIQPKEEKEYLDPIPDPTAAEVEEEKEVTEHEWRRREDIMMETQATVEEVKTTIVEQETEQIWPRDYSVLHPTVIVTEEVSTPTSLSSSVGIQMQGNLQRKHDLEGPLKKAQSRTWNNVFCVLKDNDLFFYKDVKSFSLDETLQGEEPLFLGSASCEAVVDYKKKKHADRQTWIDVLRTSIAETSDQKPKSKSLPHPSTSTTEGKPEKKEKRFSLFPSKKIVFKEPKPSTVLFLRGNHLSTTVPGTGGITEKKHNRLGDQEYIFTITKKSGKPDSSGGHTIGAQGPTSTSKINGIVHHQKLLEYKESKCCFHTGTLFCLCLLLFSPVKQEQSMEDNTLFIQCFHLFPTIPLESQP
ncbi:unnamed protein product [Ranitomeya imitator]|uniref:PH domain-containing protein n=1 Tax=Ranitomeya imitator TaxID=111125 RepID=A0ABN9M3K2_9NEOB|nr:unnamed protein product [Ranitomeya imitator]